MKKICKFVRVMAFLGIMISTLICTSSALANDYGTEITIYDGVGTSGQGPYIEDNETEPGAELKQAWDLEGFFLQDNALTIIGGYNFYTGYDGVDAGDIFIDINGDAIHSPNTIPGYNYNPGYNQLLNGLFNYDYVLDINWVAGTYDIVQLNGNSVLMNTIYGENYFKPSNPWVYVSDGEILSTQSFITYDKSSLSNTGFLGKDGNNVHYGATFGLNGINLANGALFHNTMECGNDNLLGRALPVPEPSSIILISLAGIASFISRRKLI